MRVEINEVASRGICATIPLSRAAAATQLGSQSGFCASLAAKARTAGRAPTGAQPIFEINKRRFRIAEIDRMRAWRAQWSK
jgi:hypothetical protein